jgi:ribose 1,5-bisphosphokinase PhnN
MPTHRRFNQRRTNKCALALVEHRLGVHAQREQPRGREHLNQLQRTMARGAGRA